MGSDISQRGQGGAPNVFFTPPSPKYHDYLGEQPTDQCGIERLLDNDQGYIVGRLGDHVLRHKTDLHLLTIAPTGAGKGVGSVIPNILDHLGSLFVVDIRGETVARTAQARMMLGNDVVVIDPFNETEGAFGRDTFNPLDALNPAAPDFDAKIDGMARALMFDPDGRSSSDPIWDNVTLKFLRGALSFVCTQSSQAKRNLFTVYEIVNQTQAERAMFLAELSTLALAGRGPGFAAMKEMLVLLSNAEGKKGIVEGATEGASSVFGWIARDSFPDMLTQSTFDFADLQFRDRKTTVYLVIPEEHVKSCATWIRVLFQAAMFSLKDVYKTTGQSTNALEQRDRVLFILDEMPLFGYMDTIQNGVATLRGRGANIWMLIQNLSQLEDVYGKPGARTILSNTAVIQLFDSSNDVEELEYFQKLIGDELVLIESVTNGVNETQGRSETTGTSQTEGFSETEGYSDTESTNRSRTRQSGSSFGHGGGGFSSSSNSGSSVSVGSGRSYTRNKSQAFSNSTTQTSSTSDSYSLGRSHSTTVKPERMSIETIRLLRIKITGGNQLLVVRGMYPAFTPRMSYIARYPNTGRFMFPDMQAMVSMDEIGRMLSDEVRHELHQFVESSAVDSILHQVREQIAPQLAAEQFAALGSDAFAAIASAPLTTESYGQLVAGLGSYSMTTASLLSNRHQLGAWFARLRNAEELICNLEGLVSDELYESDLLPPTSIEGLTGRVSALSQLRLFSPESILELSQDAVLAERNLAWLGHTYGPSIVEANGLAADIRDEIEALKDNYLEQFDALDERAQDLKAALHSRIEGAALLQCKRKHKVYCESNFK